MEENKNLEMENVQEREEKSMFDFSAIYTALVLNWHWFLLSLIICLGAAAIYLRYKTPIYQASAQFYIKGDDNTCRGLMSASNLGMVNYTSGLENELVILKSRTLAEQAVRDLKLYVTYRSEGKVKDQLLYKSQPINVDMDPAHLNKLSSSVVLQIKREGKGYHVTGTAAGQPIDKTIATLPSTIATKCGVLSFTANSTTPMPDGAIMNVSLVSPQNAAYRYAGALSVGLSAKSTSIVNMVFRDENVKRAADYLKQLAICFNRQANEDKNEVAVRTEEFINSRLEKINAELGSTEGALEAYKRSHNMVQLGMNASNAFNNQEAYSKQLAEASTQTALLNSIKDYMDQPDNKYQTLPSNVGLSDGTATSLINRYNELALQRNKLLRSASESSPTVLPITQQMDDLSASIRRAMEQSRKNMDIQRNSIASQYNKYAGQVSETPAQERMLNQIGRQQEVKSGLYLMLLQKREENSISLAATADKGKLIDEPTVGGKVSPKSSMIMLIGLLFGLGLPALALFLLRFFRYKIEGHSDVEKLTKLPIIADVAVASDTAKTKADIVVHENKNSQMEEVFRSMRTNLQFMMKEGQKVIMFTSSTSGEGKTFNAANLSVSFALLNKKVILVGLDIRKPRLAELFEIDDHKHGITVLLAKENPTWDDVQTQIVPSGVNNNLDLLLAGPIPPNPTELIARPSLETIIEHLKANYDYILIDTAPVGLVTDTLQIGRVADATVYMCRADYTPKESFGLINGLAAEKKLPNMSIVLNGIDMSKKKYGYYYGYGVYGRYGRYGRYNNYGYGYGKYGYGHYGHYGYGHYGYGSYGKSNYGDKNDTSIKLK